MDKKELREVSYYKATEKALHNYNNVLVSIDNKEQEIKSIIAELRVMQYEIDDYEIDTVVNETGIHSSGISKATENRINRKEQLIEVKIPKKKQELRNKKISLKKDKDKIDNLDRCVNNLNPRQKEIVEKFYKRKMRICDISQDVFLEEAQTHKIKKEAVKAIAIQLFGYDFLEQEDNLLKLI